MAILSYEVSDSPNTTWSEGQNSSPEIQSNALTTKPSFLSPEPPPHIIYNTPFNFYRQTHFTALPLLLFWCILPYVQVVTDSGSKPYRGN